MISLFHDRNVNEVQFSERVLQKLLDDSRLKEALATGRVPRIGYTTLFPKGATLTSARDESTFLEYRASALRRQAIRHELKLDTSDKLNALIFRQEQLLREFDQSRRTDDAVQSDTVNDDVAKTG